MGTIYPSGYSNNAQMFNVRPADVKKIITPADPINALITQILASNKGKTIMKRFNSKPCGFWSGVLSDPNLSWEDKFYKIFGFKFRDVVKQQAQTLLGNIFEDVGGWFSNLFSSQNLQKAEDFVRRFQNQSQNFANVLNTLRNSPNYNPQTDRKITDVITTGAFDVQDFISKYGIIVVVVLLAFIFLKK